jgi:hypothetical protein
VAKNVTLADTQVVAMLDKIKKQHHSPRLDQAEIAICFSDAKPFVKGRFNWGKTQKFSPLNKMFQGKKYDFLIILPSDGWYEVLTGKEREAWLDLHLSRCQVEYLPQYEEESGGDAGDDDGPPAKKKKPLKDKWGRIEYSTEIRYDENGEPMWKVVPLDLWVFAQNARRYGVWCEDVAEIKDAVSGPSVAVYSPPLESSLPADGGFRGRLVANADYSFSPNPGPAAEDMSDAELLEAVAG